MATPVMMPNVGITVETCILTQWCKKPGETVNEGEILFVYETDKSTLEQEAPCSGTVLVHFFDEDDDIPVMTNVCVIGNPGEDFEEFRPASSQEKSTAAAEAPKAEQEAPAVQTAQPVFTPAAIPADGIIKASPRAKALAKKMGQDIRYANGTGPNGRIIERDVRALAKAAGLSGNYADLTSADSGAADYKDEKMPNIRRTIAKQMALSLQTAAQLTHTLSFDATDILNFRKQVKANGEAMGYGNITLNDIILFVVSRVLVKPEHRALNAHLLEGDVMRYFDNVHMGIAVDTPRGLVVPTLRNCNKKSLNEISNESKALAAACKGGNMSPDILQGGTFTVSNLGAFGIEHFTPVLNIPQTAILGVNTITTQIKIVDGQLRTYQAMGLSLTYDHRAVDGGPASRLLADLKEALENFTAFLKEQEGK